MVSVWIQSVVDRPRVNPACCGRRFSKKKFESSNYDSRGWNREEHSWGIV